MVPPNVLILVIDSLRADVVYGRDVETPNLDACAGRGVSFLQCIATTTTTTPSVASILTACYPPKHGVRGLHGYRLSPAVGTFPEAFARAGYSTHAEVTGPLLPETGVLRGFDDVHHRRGYRAPFFGWRQEVVNRMTSYRSPWLTLLHVWEVHRPFRSPPDFAKRWDRAGYEAAVAATDAYLQPIFDRAGDDTFVVITADHGEEYPDTRFEQVMSRIARIARRRLKVGKWAPALERILAPHVVGHGFALYEHLVRVPLIIAGPGVPPGIAVEEQVRHVDLFPTLAELCDVPPPDGVDGRSLRALMEGESLPEEPAYMEAVGVKLEGKRIEGARTGDWKLLRPGGGKPALYPLAGASTADEKHNLISRYPEVARRLEAFLQAVNLSAGPSASGMNDAEEALVEQHLRDLGYL